MKTSMTTMLFLATVAIGCSKKDEKADKAPTNAPVPKTVEPVDTKVVEPTPTDTATEVTPTAAEEPIPTVADFEEDAVKNISDETLEEDLAAIEKELGE